MLIVIIDALAPLTDLSKTTKFVYASIEKNTEKSMVFQITGKWLNGSRLGFISTIWLNKLRIHLADTTHAPVIIFEVLPQLGLF